MSDEGGLIDPRDSAPAERHRDTLLYDYAKFLTTLSLVALGGVLGLVQAADPGRLDARNVALVLGALVAGGVASLTAASGLVDAEVTGRQRSKWPPRYLKLSMILIGVGLGVFLKIWWDTLR
jgi:hypothetical protein